MNSVCTVDSLRFVVKFSNSFSFDKILILWNDTKIQSIVSAKEELPSRAFQQRKIEIRQSSLRLLLSISTQQHFQIDNGRSSSEAEMAVPKNWMQPVSRDIHIDDHDYVYDFIASVFGG